MAALLMHWSWLPNGWTSWTSAFVFRAGDHAGAREFSIDIPTEVAEAAGHDGLVALKSSHHQKIMHDLRNFLRHAVARKLAADRPKDYGSLVAGWKEDNKFREQVYALNHFPGGPSMLAAGTITGAKAFAWDCFDDNGMCRRCGDEFDTQLHWLWQCPRLTQARHKLDERIGRHIAPEDLPESLARCGICPENFDITSRDHAAIVEYLAAANRDPRSSHQRERLPTSQFVLDGLGSSLHPSERGLSAIPPAEGHQRHFGRSDRSPS